MGDPALHTSSMGTSPLPLYTTAHDIYMQQELGTREVQRSVLSTPPARGDDALMIHSLFMRANSEPPAGPESRCEEPAAGNRLSSATVKRNLRDIYLQVFEGSRTRKIEFKAIELRWLRRCEDRLPPDVFISRSFRDSSRYLRSSFRL